MKKLYLLILAVLVASNLLSAQQKWSTFEISEPQKKDVNSILRWKEGKYEITSISSATYYFREVTTILNSKAKDNALVLIGYDKNTKIKMLEARVYNAFGKEIGKIKKNDFIDQSAISGFSMYEDNRIKYADLAQEFYPYTVEFEYQLEFDYTYMIPKWNFSGEESQYVAKSVFTLKSPNNLLPTYRSLNTDLQPQKSELNGLTTLTWEMADVAPIAPEPFSSSPESIKPAIEFQTNLFQYSGYTGDMQSWESFGLWIKQLMDGRNVLPEETISKVKALTAHLPDDRSKIKAVYEYMQNKTRYVSIQVGIGGLQPFEASLVDKVGYGDCKALSNYTMSLLGSIGIESNYAVIRANEKRPLSKDYVVPYFNHVILCVPNQGDTIWLECTSQTQPFGFLGSFTDDRDVLLITKKGGVLAKTPRYGQELNVMKTTAKVDVASTGDASATIDISYKGLESENDGLHFYLDRSNKDQKDWIYKNTDIANFDIVDFSFDHQKDEIPTIYQKLEVNIKSLASLSGKRMFIQPNLLHKRSYVPKSVENRTQPVVLQSEYINIDSIVYNIPSNIYAEHLPEAVHIESPFGEYHAEFVYEEGRLTYKRTIKMNKGTYPADHYHQLIDFYKEMVKADKIKVVFNNRT